MPVKALATDYDGTLAWHSTVEYSTCTALQKLRDSGRKLILVTGRELRELYSIFSSARIFDRIVAENGGLLVDPATNRTEVLGPEPPQQFVDRLREQGVHPLSVGHTIVATQETYSSVVQETIDDLKLEWQIIPNKGALMVLARTVDKASGLKVALRELGLSADDVVGVGDAENDHAFLNICGWSVAVSNALESLKARADIVTQGSRGAGVEELINSILDNKLPPRVARSVQQSLIQAT
jgi:hydroxymethylpyrimidine pyrophosphatase-like HAD family hydrolase